MTRRRKRAMRLAAKLALRAIQSEAVAELAEEIIEDKAPAVLDALEIIRDLTEDNEAEEETTNMPRHGSRKPKPVKVTRTVRVIKKPGKKSGKKGK